LFGISVRIWGYKTRRDGIGTYLWWLGMKPGITKKVEKLYSSWLYPFKNYFEILLIANSVQCLVHSKVNSTLFLSLRKKDSDNQGL
jgi:hypothetical protein